MARVTAPERSRRADILSAAQDEFAAAGYAGARIERIAAAAAVNKQLLFHYFRSKDGLFTVALEQLLERCEPSALSSGEQPADTIRRLLADLQAALRTMPGIAAIIADSASNHGFPADAATAVRLWRERLVARLEHAMADGQRRGYFRDDLDPRTMAALAFAAALGDGASGDGGRPLPLGALLVDYCAWR